MTHSAQAADRGRDPWGRQGHVGECTHKPTGKTACARLWSGLATATRSKPTCFRGPKKGSGIRAATFPVGKEARAQGKRRKGHPKAPHIDPIEKRVLVAARTLGWREKQKSGGRGGWRDCWGVLGGRPPGSYPTHGSP